MKSIIVICLLALAACAPSAKDEKSQGWHTLRWVEKPAARGVSQQALPKDRTQFDFVTRFDQDEPENFESHRATLREGDLVAYWMKTHNKNTPPETGEVLIESERSDDFRSQI